MNAIQSLGRSNINIAEPWGPLLIKERKHEDLEHGHHGEGEEQLHHHYSLPPPTQHPGCAQPGRGWIIFSKHIRIFIFVLYPFLHPYPFPHPYLYIYPGPNTTRDVEVCTGLVSSSRLPKAGVTNTRRAGD